MEVEPTALPLVASSENGTEPSAAQLSTQAASSEEPWEPIPNSDLWIAPDSAFPPEPLLLGELSRDAIRAVLADDLGKRYAATNTWAALLQVDRKTILATVQGQQPYALASFRKKSVPFWHEHQLDELFSRNLQVPPGYSEVVFLEQWKGQLVNERVGTETAWRRLGVAPSHLYKLLVGLEPFLEMRYGGHTARIWRESQIQVVVAAYEERQRQRHRGGLTRRDDGHGPYFSGSIEAWAQAVPFGRRRIERELDTIGAVKEQLHRKTFGVPICLYSEHALEAARVLLERQEALNQRPFIDPNDLNLVGAVDGWAHVMGVDPGSVWPYVSALQPSRTIIDQGEPERPLFTFEQIEASVPGRWLDPPEYQVSESGWAILPTGEHYLAVDRDDLPRNRDAGLRTLPILNKAGQVSEYYLLDDYIAAGGRPIWLRPEDHGRYVVQANPAFKRVARARMLVRRARELRKLGPLKLLPGGRLVFDGEEYLSLTGFRQLCRAAEQSEVLEPEQGFLAEPTQLFSVVFPGHWTKPVVLPFYLSKPIRRHVETRRQEVERRERLSMVALPLNREGSGIIHGERYGTAGYWLTLGPADIRSLKAEDFAACWHARSSDRTQTPIYFERDLRERGSMRDRSI